MSRVAVRELRRAQPDRDVLVLIRGGVYRVDQAIVFGPEDSGRQGGSVTYAAYPGQQPVLSGGRPITGFQAGPKGLWAVKISEVRAGRWFFEQLYVNSHVRVDNNIIRSAGHIWPDAVGVLIGHSGDNQVTHNDISGMPYTGISAGWRWGYGAVPSVRNTIAFNHIHHLGWDVLADMGGIYTLGESPGTVLRNNVIHDIEGVGDSGMHGLYNDNSTSQMVLENNLVYNVRDGAYQIGSGKGNTLRNNVFVARPKAASTHGQILFCMYYEKETHLAATFERNIVYGSGGKLLSVPPSSAIASSFAATSTGNRRARHSTLPESRSANGRLSAATRAQ